jgi:hypothetical protein
VNVLGKGCVWWALGIPLPIVILLFLFGVVSLRRRGRSARAFDLVCAASMFP